MPRGGVFRNNFSKGVLDPDLRQRIDLQQHQQSMLTGTNIIGKPQGGFRHRAGFRTKSRLRRQLRRIAVTAAMVTAAKGGTVANAVDQNSTTTVLTTSSVTALDWVFLQIDLGSDKAVQALDIIDFKCSLLSADNALQVESSVDASAWTPFGLAWNVRTTIRTRRSSLAPGSSRTARYWRLKINPAVLVLIGTITLGGITLWSETAKLSKVKRLEFNYALGQTYLLVLTDRNLDVFRNGVWQCAVPIEHRSDQVEQVTRASGADSTLLFHKDVTVTTILRSGAHDEWNSAPQAFTNLPTFDSGTTFTGTQREVQQVTITAIPDTNVFTLWLEGVESAAITKTGTAGSLATAIKAALDAMPNAVAGFLVTVDSFTATALVFTVIFAGTTNESRVWPDLFADVQTIDTATASTVTLQDGRTTTGSIMSKTAGWPRSGTFYQGRLWLAGFLLRPQTIISSITHGYFDFNPASTGSDRALDFTLDSDEVATIHAVYAGRHLQILSDIGEWYINNRVIDGTQPLNFILATRNGIKPGTDVVTLDGASVFVSGSSDEADAAIPLGGVLREFLYSEGEQDYTAEPLSLLASHLVSDIQSVSFRRSAKTSEGSQLWIANTDGAATVLVFSRAQEIAAFYEANLGDKVRAFGVDGGRRVYAFVERTAGGQADLWLEQQDPTALLDASIAFTNAPASATITGLDHLEGRIVGVFADGDWQGSYTVAGGAVTLPRVVTSGEAGLDTGLMVEPMPVREIDREGKVVDKFYRVYRAILHVKSTGAITFSANDGALIEIPIPAMETAEPFTPLLERLYTGELIVENLMGRAREGRCVLSRPYPAPLEVHAIQMEIR